MEAYVIVLIVVLSGLFSALFGYLWRWMFEFRRDRRLRDCEDGIERLQDQVNAFKGNIKREENKELSKEGMAQLAAIWQGEGTQQEKIQASIPIAVSNPALLKEAMKLIGKL